MEENKDFDEDEDPNTNEEKMYGNTNSPFKKNVLHKIPHLRKHPIKRNLSMSATTELELEG